MVVRRASREALVNYEESGGRPAGDAAGVAAAVSGRTTGV